MNLLTCLGHHQQSRALEAVLMSVHETLKTAIWCRRPVELLTAGCLRQVCPHALGYKHGRLKVLVFQFSGESA